MVLAHWLHLLAAIVWVGGAAFIPLVLVPALRKKTEPKAYLALLSDLGEKFRVVGWVCIILLLATGLYRIGPVLLRPNDLLATLYGRLLLGKLVLVVIILVFSIFHDFVWGPAVSRAAQDDDPALAWKRSVVAWLARLQFLLMLGVVSLAAYLRMGPR